MTHKDIELSLFLDMPVADGLDAVENALALYKFSRGEARARARAKQILFTLERMFSKIAPKCTSAVRWEDLKRRIHEEIRQANLPLAISSLLIHSRHLHER